MFARISHYVKRTFQILSKGKWKEVLGKIQKTLQREIVKSRLANIYCKGQGIEIGGAEHNSFGLKTLNVDYTNELTVFKLEEVRTCGSYMPVDIVAAGDNIPVTDESFDFVINSHVLEHFLDPMKALLEWYRIVKKGGIIFMIVPHKERTFDKERPRTTLKELIERHAGITDLKQETYEHFSVWITQDLLELIIYMNNSGIFPKPVIIEAIQDVDDKVGHGFTVVLRKQL
jgi:SAM-dependent methyltransferase